MDLSNLSGLPLNINVIGQLTIISDQSNRWTLVTPPVFDGRLMSFLKGSVGTPDHVMSWAVDSIPRGHELRDLQKALLMCVDEAYGLSVIWESVEDMGMMKALAESRFVRSGLWINGRVGAVGMTVLSGHKSGDEWNGPQAGSSWLSEEFIDCPLTRRLMMLSTSQMGMMIRSVMEAFTDEGDLIMDPWMFSHIIGKRAISNRRRFLGICKEVDLVDNATFLHYEARGLKPHEGEAGQMTLTDLLGGGHE